MTNEVIYSSPIEITPLPTALTQFEYSFTVECEDGSSRKISGTIPGPSVDAARKRALSAALRHRGRLIERGVE